MPGDATQTGLTRAAGLWRTPWFRALWAGHTLHVVALQLQLFTLQWFATELTDSRTYMGLILALQGGTVAFASPLAGAAADRLASRDLLFWCRIGLAVAVLGFAGWVYAGRAELVHLYGLALGLGLLMAIGQPASQTYLFDVVGRARTQAAVAMSSAGVGLGQMAGPALGGLCVAAIGVAGSWSLAGAVFLAAAWLVRVIPIRGQSDPAIRLVGGGLRAGLAYVWRDPPLRLAMLICAMAFWNGALAAMRPVFARYVIEVGSTGMGALAASMGLGNFVGALVATTWPDFRRPGLAITGAMLGYALVILLYSFAFSFEYLLVLEFAAGLFGQLWQISTFGGLQMAVTPEMRGRVMGLVFTVAQLSLLGSVFVGGLADAIGDQPAMAVFGAVPSLLVVGMLIFGGRTLARLGQDGDAATPG